MQLIKFAVSLFGALIIRIFTLLGSSHHRGLDGRCKRHARIKDTFVPVPVQAMKAYRGRMGIVAPILNVHIDGREHLFYDPAALPLGKKPVPVD